MIKEQKCNICGCTSRKKYFSLKINGEKYTLCSKHYNQYKKYNKFLDNNPYTRFDLNKINIIDNNYAEIEIRDWKNNEELKEIVIIDTEDVDKIKNIRWYTTNQHYVYGRKNGEIILLHRYLLNLGKYNKKTKDNMVDHIDGNPLNNSKSNLRTCSPKENARNTRNQYVTESGVIGVRKDTRCKNSWRAQIYFSQTDHIEKTYQDKELAIIQRLIWELKYFKEFSPQIDLIKEKYKYLLGYNKICDYMDFDDDIEHIKKVGEHLLKDEHCPCSLIKNESTICPCEKCRNEHTCHCGIFKPIKEQ